ncbi:formylglycine-generating enzyme family protein [Mesoterricola silvestris]|uniref:formylglycine-generating enzyme family protein n=1 Tax=Mesoterricola silvestris TaxID=2927979 RepID=UPI00292D5B86|nr:formylglycine-generating enzyme family protein [Mesoterricola silvestris]
MDTPTTFTLTVTSPDGQEVARPVTVDVKPALLLRSRGLRFARVWVTVTGPWGYREVVQAPCTLRGLQRGAYTLQAGEVEDGGIRKVPWEPVLTAAVDTAVVRTFSYPEPTFTVDLPGCEPIEFLLMPAGTFQMGTEETEGLLALRGPLPRPVHGVTFRAAFYMAKHLTTRDQWWAVSKGGQGEKPANPTFPVDEVSHLDITQRFLPALAPRCPNQAFALPSEAMWEYACRAGTSTRYFFGPDESHLDEYFWRRSATPAPGHPVGSKLPNPWGLHDLSGLGFQWCADASYPDYVGAPTDGSARLVPLRDWDYFIARGGDGINTGGPSAARQEFPAWSRSSLLGFRLVATRPWFSPED